jgi:hypothetical protein
MCETSDLFEDVESSAKVVDDEVENRGNDCEVMYHGGRYQSRWNPNA